MASWIQSNAVLNADSKKKLLASSSKKRKSSSGTRSRGLGTSLSLFEEPPTSTISLEEFERFAIDRMHVLRGIHDLKTVQNLKGGACLGVGVGQRERRFVRPFACSLALRYFRISAVFLPYGVAVLVPRRCIVGRDPALSNLCLLSRIHDRPTFRLAH